MLELSGDIEAEDCEFSTGKDTAGAPLPDVMVGDFASIDMNAPGIPPPDVAAGCEAIGFDVAESYEDGCEVAESETTDRLA
jgi:hypothetical protein